MADGYVESSRSSELIDALIDLHVLCLNGEGFMLRLSPSTLGRDVRKMVSERLPAKKGAKLAIYHLTTPLILAKSLQEQGISGKTERLLCTYVPTDLYAAWCYLQGFQVFDEEFALDGISEIRMIRGRTYVQHLDPLPKSLEKLTFGEAFNQSLERVSLPGNLQSLTLGDEFNQSHEFNQSLDRVTLPGNLQSLTFGRDFNNSLEGVTLPGNLQSLTFGFRFNQSLERVTLPGNLQSLTFGDGFNQSLERVILPGNLQSLTFGGMFNQPDFWFEIQPKPWTSDLARKLAKSDFWWWVQPEPRTSDLARQLAKPDFWRYV